MRRRLAAAAASVALLSMLLAGCATIPSSGPVQQGDPVPADSSPDLDIVVEGPTADATQEQILEGFLNAAQSPRNNYQVAREYLTPTFADEWQADAAATIDVLVDREREVVDDTTIRIDATPAASLRDNGQYEEPESRTPDPARLPVRAGRGAVAHLERADGHPHRPGELHAGLPRLHAVLLRSVAPLPRARRALVRGAGLGADQHRAGDARGARRVAVARGGVGVPRGHAARTRRRAGVRRRRERLARRGGLRRPRHGAADAGAARREPHRGAQHQRGRPHVERRRPRCAAAREPAGEEPARRSAIGRVRRRVLRLPGDLGGGDRPDRGPVRPGRGARPHRRRARTRGRRRCGAIGGGRVERARRRGLRAPRPARRPGRADDRRRGRRLVGPERVPRPARVVRARRERVGAGRRALERVVDRGDRGVAGLDADRGAPRRRRAHPLRGRLDRARRRRTAGRPEPHGAPPRRHLGHAARRHLARLQHGGLAHGTRRRRDPRRDPGARRLRARSGRARRGRAGRRRQRRPARPHRPSASSTCRAASGGRSARATSGSWRPSSPTDRLVLPEAFPEAPRPPRAPSPRAIGRDASRSEDAARSIAPSWRRRDARASTRSGCCCP